MNAAKKPRKKVADELALLPAPEPEIVQAASELAERAPTPARWHNVLCGIAGWTDKSLVKSGLFYPHGVSSPEARLTYYAEQFSLVEVDATYYALLSADVVARWTEWTPPSFCFDVKAHPVLTQHPIDVARLPGDLQSEVRTLRAGGRVYASALPEPMVSEIEARFFASIAPLVDAGRLGAVFLQFPPWFGATRGNARHLEGLRERNPALPLAVEFRNKTWLAPERRARLADLLGKLELSYVCVDEPAGKVGGLPPLTLVTNPALAVVRFHGQNAAGWAKRGASVHERFNYLYAPQELAAWAPRVRELGERAARVHAVFNNCVHNYAVLGAKDLSVLLEDVSPSNDEQGTGS